jgi:hypothetical protein
MSEQTQAADDENRKALELALERARYEANRAQRQFDAVEPENRLVASELEDRWNSALAQVAELEARLTAMGEQSEAFTEQQEQELMALSEDLPALWNHPEASVQLKKRILRTVLVDIIIDTDKESSVHQIHLHWASGVHTELRVPRGKTGQHRRSADRTVIDLARELAKVCPDKRLRRF